MCSTAIFERFFRSTAALIASSLIRGVPEYACGAGQCKSIAFEPKLRAQTGKWMETKIEYIIKGIEEIKAKIKKELKMIAVFHEAEEVPKLGQMVYA